MAHSAEVRAQVIAALLAGQGVLEVARQYKLPKQTVSRFKNSCVPDELGRVGPKNRETLDSLLLEAVSANISALTAIADAVSEPEYVSKQPADSVGVLYGILADKAVRFLEAASFGAGDAPEES